VKIIVLVEWRQPRVPFVPLEQLGPLLPNPFQPRFDNLLVVWLQEAETQAPHTLTLGDNTMIVDLLLSPVSPI
jgi:hypothetical protein